jgi:hypothetical protein
MKHFKQGARRPARCHHLGVLRRTNFTHSTRFETRKGEFRFDFEGGVSRAPPEDPHAA